METSVSHQVAAKLLEVKAIQLNLLNPYKWASGWNSPIYCDNRLTLSYPEIRSFIKEELKNLIMREFRDVEIIAGVATAGIPQGALVAEALDLPFMYVRSKPKEHGMTNMIEGLVTKGQKVVLVEDLISTGGSSIKAVNALRNAGMNVMGLVAIFTYCFQVADDNFNNADVKVATLSNYKDMIDQALVSEYISEGDVESLKDWRKEPSDWRN